MDTPFKNNSLGNFDRIVNLNQLFICLKNLNLQLLFSSYIKTPNKFLLRSSCLTNTLQIKYPLITKKISTPRYPELKKSGFVLNKITETITIPLRDCM